MIGWLGGILIAVHLVPQVWKSIKEGHAEGISAGTLALGFAAIVILLADSRQALSNDLALMFTYSANLMCLFVIVRYKVQPRKSAPVISLVKRGRKR